MPTLENDICDAIKRRVCVYFVYDDHERIMEPHPLGHHNTTGNLSLRCFQVSGTSETGEVPAWKLVSIKKVRQFRVLEKKSMAPRPGYNPLDKHIRHPAICSIN